MAISKKRIASRDWLTLFNVGTIRDLTDGQLLERFATLAGEPAELAFAALVERHGPMVLRVCGAALPDSNDAHDAFQAVFLVLVKKARGLWVKDSLGPWLHAVACRTARQMRANAMRRQRLERNAAVSAYAIVETSRDLDHAVHEEIHRLPERYRAAVVLCDLEGRTHEQAARHLGWPVGTVKSRQARARQRLRKRLARRGLDPGAAILPALNLPQTLIDATSRMAVQAATSKVLAATTSTVLAREVIRSMFMLRLTKIASVMILAAGTVTGAGLSARSLVPGDDPTKADDVTAVEVKVGREARVLKERGSLEAVNTEDGINQVEGMTTIISIVPEGILVKEGQLVCRLDSARLRDGLAKQEVIRKEAFTDLENAERTRNVAMIAIKEYTEGTFPAQRAELNDEISLTTLQIEAASERVERLQSLAKEMDGTLEAKGEAVTPMERLARVDVSDRLDAARVEVVRQTRANARARQRLNVLESYTKTRVVAELEAQVSRSQIAVLAAEASYKLAEAKEDKFRTQIERCKLHATTSGLVVYANDRHVVKQSGRVYPAIEEGATVRERQKLFSIVDIGGPMRVNTKIHESLVDFVYPGQKTTVKVDALPDRTFDGIVKSVSPVPDAVGPTKFGKTTYYTTVVELTDQNAQLRPGMTAEASIQTEDMLAVPDKATYEIDGTRYVAVKKADGTFEPRKLNAKYGIPGTWFVEVKPDGIQKGDTLAADPTTLPQADLQPR